MKNSLVSSVCEIGYLGNGRFRPSNVPKCYNIWHQMIRRVHDPKTSVHLRNYHDVVIDPIWYNFQNFAEWYYYQIDHFGPVTFHWNLDKDLLFPMNRKYGPDVCCLIPQHLNKVFNDYSFGQGQLPLGVIQHGRLYKVRVSDFGKRKYLGLYKTVHDAQIAYWTVKFEVIRNTTIQYWQYLPEPLAFRLLCFGWEDAIAYYGDKARLWSN